MKSYDKPVEEQLTKGKLEEAPNHTVVQKISRPKELILLFWVDEKNRSGILYTEKEMFKAAAQTRAQNIKKAPWYIENIHKIHQLPIQAVHEIGTRVYELVNDYGGSAKARVREVSVFSHCGVDGPITYHSTVHPPLDPQSATTQMHISGWAAINFNWLKDEAMCVFYGGNSARYQNSFAERLSLLDNFKNVVIWGQINLSYPSFFPDYRVSSTDRSVGVGWSFDKTYMVGGVAGQGWQSISIRLKTAATLTKEELKKFPRVEPMQSYKNGNKLIKTHQGLFNDHRPYI